MAVDKKSFLLYADLIHTVKKMGNENAGELFLHILEYVNDTNPSTDNLIVELTFEPIKQQFKRDLRKWENTLESKSESGKIGNLKRWNNDLYLKFKKGELSLNKCLEIANSRRTSLSDKNIANVAVNVNDTVNVTVNDIIIKKSIVERKTEFKNSLTPFLIIYSKDLLNAFFSYWTEHGEKDKKMRFEKEKSYNIERRLQTWKANENKFGSKKEKLTGAAAFKQQFAG